MIDPPNTTGLSIIRGVCKACEDSMTSKDRRLRCTRIDGTPAIGDLLGKGDFCPLKKHDAIAFVPITVEGWRPQKPSWLSILRNGLRGLVVYLLRRCVAPEATVAARRALCAGCIHRREITGVAFCGKCKCVLRAKTAVANQQCPVGKWKAADISVCRSLRGLPILGWLEPRVRAGVGCGCGQQPQGSDLANLSVTVGTDQNVFPARK